MFELSGLKTVVVVVPPPSAWYSGGSVVSPSPRSSIVAPNKPNETPWSVTMSPPEVADREGDTETTLGGAKENMPCPA